MVCRFCGLRRFGATCFCRRHFRSGIARRYTNDNIPFCRDRSLDWRDSGSSRRSISTLRSARSPIMGVQRLPECRGEKTQEFLPSGRLVCIHNRRLLPSLECGVPIIVGKRLPYNTMPDYTSMRLALLASMALGLFLFAVGAWPIVRNVVANAEAEKRMGNTKYMASPRLLLALLPIFTGTLSLLINWLFH